MTELLLPRLKQEIETRLAELRPLIAEIEQLEAAKVALLDRGDLPAALALAAPARRRAGRNGAAVAAAPPVAPARRRRAAAPAAPKREAAEGERAPRGANRDAIVQLVEERPGVSVAEIASVTKIAKPTVATTVSKLKREGVFADEAGGVKLASRQPLSLSGPAAAAAAPEAPAPAAEEPAPTLAEEAAAEAPAAAEEAAAAPTPAKAARRRAAKPASRGAARASARRARAAKKPARAASDDGDTAA